MTEDTTNLLWGPIENLRDLLAASTAFQTFCGVEDTPEPEDDPPGIGPAAAAHARVYCPALTGDSFKAARPYGLLSVGDEWSASMIATSGFSRSGEILLLLEADVPEEHQGEDNAKLAAAEQWFLSAVGDIVEDLLVASAAEGALALKGVKTVLAPCRADLAIRTDEGDFYQTILSVAWGTD